MIFLYTLPNFASQIYQNNLWYHPVYILKKNFLITTLYCTYSTTMSDVVLHLAEDFSHKGYVLFKDKFYNSIPFTKALTSKSLYVCGTLRSNRTENP